MVNLLLPTILLILPSAFFILRKWQSGVVLFFIFLILEDSARKIIPGQPSYVMLLKDIILFLTYSSFFFYFTLNHKKIWKPPFAAFLAILSFFLLVGIFNPNSPNLFFGLIGLRSYFWYAPLIFLGYCVFNDKEKLFRFCKILVFMAIPLLVFALLQYFFSNSDFALLNAFESGHNIHSFGWIESGEVPLLPSVFGSGPRYGRFSMFLFFLGLGLLGLKKKDKLVVLSTTSAFFGVFLSGSRVAFALTVIGAILFVFLTFNFRKNIFKIILWGILALIFISLFFFSFFKDTALFQISAFKYFFTERIFFIQGDFGRAISEAILFGNGTGTLSQGRESIPGGLEWYEYQTYELRQGFWFESGLARVIFELGIVGALIFYAFWVNLFYLMKKELNDLRKSKFYYLASGMAIFSLVMVVWYTFFHHQVLGDAVTLAPLWLAIGLFFRLKNLDLKADSVVK